MSDALPKRELGSLRSLRDEERSLITKLVSGAPFEREVLDRLDRTQVRDMPDGGMGSLRFEDAGSNAMFGKEIAEGAFRDADGVPVSVTLNLDKAGHLFELDIFKGDGSRLRRYPAPEEFEIIHRQGKVGFLPER